MIASPDWRQQTEVTGDGSPTFFSLEFGETFHSRQGARSEAIEKFALATDLPQKAAAGSLVLLDICYGLGYNTAAALEVIWQQNPQCQVTVWGLDLDRSVACAALDPAIVNPLWSAPVGEVLQALGETGTFRSSLCQATLDIGDARQTLPPLSATVQADAIFLDPFSPRRCPQLWTVDFLHWVAHSLAPEGKLATYCRAAAVRSALHTVGLTLGTVPIPQPAPRFEWANGTIAAHPQSQAAQSLIPLSSAEQEHLQTRAGIPYRDPTLQDPAPVILARRSQEQQHSQRESTTQWRKRWGIE